MKPTFHRRLAKIADIVRKEGKIDRVNLCIKADITQATLYNYKSFLTQLYPEITYQEGLFIYHEEMDATKH